MGEFKKMSDNEALLDAAAEDILTGGEIAEASDIVTIDDVLFFDTQAFMLGVIDWSGWTNCVVPLLSEDQETTIGYARCELDGSQRVVGSLHLIHNCEDRLLLQNGERIWPEISFSVENPNSPTPVSKVTGAQYVTLRRDPLAPPWRPYIKLMEVS